MGFKTPKKALATEGFARWAQNEHLRSIKTPIFAKFRTFAPKTRFGRFLPFWAQKERKIDFGGLLAPKTNDGVRLGPVQLRDRSIFASEVPLGSIFEFLT